jgi:hypothetical protein
MVDVDEEEIFETAAEERKDVKDSHRVFLRAAEKGFKSDQRMHVSYEGKLCTRTPRSRTLRH